MTEPFLMQDQPFPDAVTSDGWLENVRREPSPNFDERPAGETISLLVVHAISLPPGEFGSDDVLALFANRLDPQRHPFFAGIADLRVSAHFLVRRDGELIQFVSCNARAWHAGVSCWRGRSRCNDFSIGIELEGCDEQPFADAQYETLNALIATLVRVYPLREIVGHCHIAPERKTDPGPCFEWARVNFSSALAAR
ncbi:MAG: 1,6-anhydro-N-acetylmuramyl-L-alanine amidase AmpD [Rhodocyclaceae bacterium]|nr:1,6-anhydro-N-acetylmuramyl-L-alanine amidase AmpD [Rhodocyclaceae bacterium]